MKQNMTLYFITFFIKTFSVPFTTPIKRKPLFPDKNVERLAIKIGENETILNSLVVRSLVVEGSA